MKPSMLVFMAIIFVAGLIGWVMNIIAIVHANIFPLSGTIILRIAGIFAAPLGAVMGWFF